VLGIVIVAGYLLYAMQRALFGPFRADTDHEIVRAATHDTVPLVVLVLAAIVLGVAPEVVFGMIRDASTPIVALLGGGA